jgi:predicted transcriptional regulator
MSDKLENITGSGIPITIKGKEYKLGIFGMRDLADFRQYIKGQRVKIIQDVIQYDDEEMRKKEIEMIQDTIKDKIERAKLINGILTNFETDRMKIINDILASDVKEQKELSTIDGVCFMLWKSLQKYQPEMTLKDMDELIDLDNYSEIFNILMNVGGKAKNPRKRAKKK